ncbi:hypothetical protein GEMRC1_009506 [Eukaryota sp. GEM-RC1]
MCKSYGIVSFLEPVLAGLFDDTDVDKSFGNSRGDVLFPGLDGSFIIADVMSIDVCNDSNKKLAKSNAKNPLLIGEKLKMQKYCAKLKLLNSTSHSNYLLYPFVFSLYGSLGESASSLLEIFVKIVKEKTFRTFDLRFWKNRIVFAIFKGMVTSVSRALLSLGRHNEDKVGENFQLGNLDFEDIDY